VPRTLSNCRATSRCAGCSGELAGERTARRHPGAPATAASTSSIPAAVPNQADASRFPAFDVHAVRRDFPILGERVNGRPLIWFDNAATTQKPQAVIDRLA
jgi:cysteine desulfurase/selenocysteine lyase